jgi:hypothetical protein
MTAAVIVGLLLPIATGLLLVSRPLAPGRSVWLERLLRLPMAMGLGVGIHATGFFLSLLLFDGTLAGIAVVDAVLLLLAGAGWVANRSAEAPTFEPPLPHLGSLRRGLAVFLILLLLVSTIAFVFASIEEPHGGWDAWAIWNLRARFLARADTHWPAAFSSNMQHTDYPLLVPGAIARIWTYSPGESPLAPIALVLLFALSTIALTCGAGPVERSGVSVCGYRGRVLPAPLSRSTRLARPRQTNRKTAGCVGRAGGSHGSVDEE